jgi:hypothetical protein
MLPESKQESGQSGKMFKDFPGPELSCFPLCRRSGCTLFIITGEDGTEEIGFSGAFAAALSEAAAVVRSVADPDQKTAPRSMHQTCLGKKSWRSNAECVPPLRYPAEKMVTCL